MPKIKTFLGILNPALVSSFDASMTRLEKVLTGHPEPPANGRGLGIGPLSQQDGTGSNPEGEVLRSRCEISMFPWHKSLGDLGAGPIFPMAVPTAISP
jgi:hypothetical protein